MMAYLINLLLVTSQIINTLFGGRSQETFSSRCYRDKDKLFFNGCRKVINKVHFWQTNHCEIAYNFEIRRVNEMKEILENHDKDAINGR